MIKIKIQVQIDLHKSLEKMLPHFNNKHKKKIVFQEYFQVKKKTVREKVLLQFILRLINKLTKKFQVGKKNLFQNN